MMFISLVFTVLMETALYKCQFCQFYFTERFQGIKLQMKVSKSASLVAQALTYTDSRTSVHV